MIAKRPSIPTSSTNGVGLRWQTSWPLIALLVMTGLFTGVLSGLTCLAFCSQSGRGAAHVSLGQGVVGNNGEDEGEDQDQDEACVNPSQPESSQGKLSQGKLSGRTNRFTRLKGEEVDKEGSKEDAEHDVAQVNQHYSLPPSLLTCTCPISLPPYLTCLLVF